MKDVNRYSRCNLPSGKDATSSGNAPAYNESKVADPDVANLCLVCVHREDIRWVLDMPFCYASATTCSRRYGKKRCEDFKRKELTLF